MWMCECEIMSLPTCNHIDYGAPYREVTSPILGTCSASEPSFPGNPTLKFPGVHQA